MPNGVFAYNGYFESANEIESNPSAAVLPLFDDAHRIMGNVDKRVPVNTFNNANDYGIRTLQYEVEFNSPVSSDDLDMFYLNFFIVNGGNARIVQKSIWLVINRLIGLKLRQIIMLLMTLTIQIRQCGDLLSR